MRRIARRLVTSSGAASVSAVPTIVYGVDGTGHPTSGQAVPFDQLWLLAAGVVALLLLVRLVRIQSLWRRRPVGEPRNEITPGDVKTDE